MTARLERRMMMRRVDESSHGVRAVRLRTGHRTTLVDVSDAGVGFETDAGIAPGTPVEVVVVAADDSRSRRAFVVHSRVCRVHPTDGVRYRVGVRLQPEMSPRREQERSAAGAVSR